MADWAKALAIYLVVMSHTTISRPIANWAFMVEIPLFFFMSGFLFRFDRHPIFKVFVIKRFFERQKCEHQICGSAYFENAFLSPRPDGRTDIMNGFDTLLFKVTFEGNIEVRRINANKNIWL